MLTAVKEFCLKNKLQPKLYIDSINYGSQNVVTVKEKYKDREPTDDWELGK
ncbi:MAG: hypothetical protein PHR96_03765 [Clostridia bacterium]|nr:hypothetical protein [Clostridia bacterium]